VSYRYLRFGEVFGQGRYAIRSFRAIALKTDALPSVGEINPLWALNGDLVGVQEKLSL
jgi:hypothetical protein